MRRQDLSKWKDDPTLEGLLIFSESLDELLFDHTLDSFKAPALNFHVSIVEVRSLLSQLVAGRIRLATLVHAIYELDYHLHHDPVVPSPIPTVWQSYVTRLKDLKTSPKKLFVEADALLIDVGRSYWDLLRAAIAEQVCDPKQKKKILSLTRAFTAEIELQGFSRRYAYFENHRFFFNPKRPPERIENTSVIHAFLSLFDRNERARQVFLRCSRAYNDFAEQAPPFGIRIDNNCPEIPGAGVKARAFLGESRWFPLYVTIKDVEAKDEFLAHDKAHAQFDLFTDVCRFAMHTADLDAEPSAVVAEADFSHAYVINARPNPMTFHADRGPRQTAAIVQTTIEILSGWHFTASLRRNFQKVLDYHETALSAKTPQNQLLNLWSCVEGFLPPPDEKTVRINYYLSAFVPVLILTYTDRVLSYVASFLRKSDNKVAEFVEDIPVDGSFENKTAALLTCKEFEAQRERLVELITYSPLLRNRCYWCYLNFRSKRAIRQTLEAHRDRVTWHIKRIYTTRNQIVHSAESLPYVGTLVENLHSYLDILAECAIRGGIAAVSPVEIDSLLLVFQTHAKAHLESLGGVDKECELNDYRDLLFSQCDLLSQEKRGTSRLKL